MLDDAVSADAVSTDAVSADAVGIDSVGTDTVGIDAVGTDSLPNLSPSGSPESLPPDLNQDLTQMDLDSLWHPLVQHRALERTPPKRMAKGVGCYVTDADGKNYLDGISGLWCVNVGYGRQELAEVAYNQMVELAYFPLTMSHESAIVLAQKLLSLLGFEGKVFFSNSGSEANEVAFKVARQYQSQASGQTSGQSGLCYKIISRYRGYHGSTMGALSATAQAERKLKYEPLVPGFLHVQPPYCYRCPFGKTYGNCRLECATSIESTIVNEGPASIAAVIVEPIIAGGGVIVPPDEYLPMLRAICDRHGILLIFDEVVNGFGRTGKMFGHQHWDVKPDLISLAKGITSGYMPLSATVVQQPVFEAFLDDTDSSSHFRHVTTYGGHPVATAVALRNIEILEAEALATNAAEMGDYLIAALQDALLPHPQVGDVRGKGLFIGIELVVDKPSKEPLAAAAVVAIAQSCMAQGLIVGRNVHTVPGFTNVLILAPPLILTRSDADRIVSVLTQAIYSSAR